MLGSKTTSLHADQCINFENNSLSFKLDLVEPCGDNQVAWVTVYHEPDCQYLFSVYQAFSDTKDVCYRSYSPARSANIYCADYGFSGHIGSWQKYAPNA